MYTLKKAGLGDSARQFFQRSLSRVPAQGAAGVAQRLFSNRVRPTDERILSRVNLLNVARDAVFGSPIEVARELRAYGRTPKGFSPGQALKRFYYRSAVPSSGKNTHPVMRGINAGITGMNLALPAMEMYGAWKAAPENRPEAVGRAAASVLASPFTMRLGIPGMFMDSAAASLGGAIGRRFGSQPQVSPSSSP